MSEKTLNVRINDFTGHLRSLAIEGKEQRAALAALRSGLGQKPGEAAAQYPHVMPFLDTTKRTGDKWFFVVGALFAWHPASSRRRYSLGAAMRQLKDKQGTSESIEKRFEGLLASDERDLHLHLRQVVGLLRANDVPVDWHELLCDLTLTGWNDSERRVQMKWARHYYRDPRTTSQTSDSEPDTES